MIVTTAGRTNAEITQYAEQVAKELNLLFITRNKQSIKDIQTRVIDDVLIVGKNRLEVHPLHSSEPLFFHPNSSMFRIKRLLKNEEDPFIQVSNLSNGKHLLDCTLGLGSDSIVASFVVGNSGKVVGIEGSKYIAYLLTKGLCTWESGIEAINEAMQRIHVVNTDYLTYLRDCSDRSFDIVYFDPMFEEEIPESTGINGLKNLAIKSTLTSEVIEEAKRVAKDKVVLKDHWKSTRFDQFGFEVIKRKSAKFHFGVIEVN